MESTTATSSRASSPGGIAALHKWVRTLTKKPTREALGGSLTAEIRSQFGTEPPLGQFLQQVDLRQKTPPPSADDVQCLTIHLAKGKEFQHVYLTGLVEDELPSYRAVKGGPSAIEEERRTCFVAITRVQSSLTLTHADSCFGWSKRPSRFLAEMGLLSGDRGR